jgi:hypothetical protein
VGRRRAWLVVDGVQGVRSSPDEFTFSALGAGYLVPISITHLVFDQSVFTGTRAHVEPRVLEGRWDARPHVPSISSVVKVIAHIYIEIEYVVTTGP